MPKRMLVDAVYEDETRIVIQNNNRLEEFDYETAHKNQLKGNIYLAKVTRVEPSLQAAFVEYGANKHGFLPFSEIHPDYYQIPVADKKKLLEEAVEDTKISDDDPLFDEENANEEGVDTFEPDETVASSDEADGDDENEGSSPDGNVSSTKSNKRRKRRKRVNYDKYTIQEVIKRNQIIQVQVIKEERGNKGASLTTYIALAGRYCVLMPNSPRQGGVSRRIMNAEARRKLKDIVDGLGIPKGTSVIVRTAGAERNKAEIKRDYDYLVRLWNNIREHTLSSTAPAFIHAEGGVLKRCIRDLYDSSIDEILIAGEEAYHEAKEFMKMIMPSHANRIKQYKNKVPLFVQYRVDEHIASLYSPTAQMPSGGYIVLDPTEALIAIDVNSGRATSERNIEETALKTNLEAAREVARQLRLRVYQG